MLSGFLRRWNMYGGTGVPFKAAQAGRAVFTADESMFKFKPHPCIPSPACIVTQIEVFIG
jgi:hypothetical protein